MTVRTYPAGAPADLRRIAILGGCVILHVGVLAVLGLTAIEQANPAPSDDQPLFVIELTPRLRLQGPDSRAPTPSSAEPESRALTAAAAVPPSPGSPVPTPPVPRAQAEPVHPPGALGLPGAAPLPVSPGDAAIARSLRNGALGCRLGRSSPADQDRCDRATAEATDRAAPISGSGAPGRDARFAALGAEALARYEDKRKPLKPYSRAEPCPGSPRPSDDCALTLQGRIWSNRDGWLPDLPRPH